MSVAHKSCVYDHLQLTILATLVGLEKYTDNHSLSVEGLKILKLCIFL
jgi:hypothetical protein